jgi:hypothetical protein
MSTALENISEETLEGIKKAQTTGITVGTGITGVDLSGLISLIPVRTPLFDRITRTSGKGSDNASWKALTNINNQQLSPFAGREGGGKKVIFNESQVYATYQPLRMVGQYTLDARDLAKDYADVKAIAVAGTMHQWKIAANKAYYGAQAFALPAIATPTLVELTSGGTMPASTPVYVKVAARSGQNYYWPNWDGTAGSGIASAAANLTTAAAAGHAVTASVAEVPGAFAYDWYVGGTAGTQYYLTTTTVNTLTITAVPVANATSAPKTPGMTTVVPTAVPVADTTMGKDSAGNVSAFNGLYATLYGDYGSNGLVTRGTGSSSGAALMSLDGGKLTLGGQGVNEIDTLLINLWEGADLSPSALVMNGQQSKDIAARVFSAGAASTFLQPNSENRIGVTAGGSAAQYVNPVTGDVIPIIVDPHAPAGRIAAITDHVDYPNSGVTNTLEARTLRDVSQWDYAVAHASGAGGGPAEVWDVSSMETFVNRAPVTMGVISNIAKG